MARRQNALKNVSIDDSPSGAGGRMVAQRAQIIRVARNGAGNGSAPSKKKKPNRVEKLAITLSIPRSSIYSYLPEGWIPCAPMGNRWLIPNDAEERLRVRAYENWRAPNKDRQQRRKEGCDSDDGPVKIRRSWRSSGVGTGGAKRRRTANAWLSPRQFARRFGVGTDAVYGAVERGEVPAIRLGRHIRIPPDTVEMILLPIITDNRNTG
jgi:excisionase family DNA binding protein